MIERDVMEYDVLIVGGGPAGLACAIRLKQLKADLNVCVLEKASAIGAQALSGAVLEAGPLDELLPGWREDPPGICIPAKRDEFSLLTKTGKIKHLSFCLAVDSLPSLSTPTPTLSRVALPVKLRSCGNSSLQVRHRLRNQRHFASQLTYRTKAS